MHVHMSLFRGGENAFYDPHDPIKFSRLARQFMAGLLRHAPEISIVTNQWVNSYKRLVAGYEAPRLRLLGQRQQRGPRPRPPPTRRAERSPSAWSTAPRTPPATPTSPSPPSSPPA